MVKHEMNKISIITVTRNRPQLLTEKALSSLLKQTSWDFEWIVINDGGSTETRNLIEQAQTDFKITYQEITHPEFGFALCHGRNLGLKLAKNNLIAYLDDDNALAPNFVAYMASFMSANPQIKLALPLQKRSRQVWQNGNVVVRGQTFISPQINSTIDDLICHRELMDSNGLTHHHDDAPTWNPNYRIYCDYEYFLQSLSKWGSSCFSINSQPLVEYIQSNQGIIGQSNYGDWAKELQRIIDDVENYRILTDNLEYLKCLQALQDKYELKQQKKLNLPAFKER